MSTRTSPESLRWLDNPPWGRRRPRDHAPEPLFGPPNVNYPGDDGRPMSDNTLQYEWIVTIKGGLDVVFADNPDVFVAGNQMWYPVEGKNRRRLAPDVMVIFGRPKGYRTSYIQHEEGGIGPQVVFEIHSPSNRQRVMDYKRNFYERYGVEEYYYFDPYKIRMDGWIREGEILRPIVETSGWVSPRLGIRFELGEDLTIFDPDGRRFTTFAETARQRDASEQIAREATDRAGAEHRRAEAERRKAATEKRKAEAERIRAEAEMQKAEAERIRAEAEKRRADRLAARLRALGLDPEESD
ncbi:Uma2 family endonuclease [Tundrisphaera lichenicola]|uniref:Uma2 family endonuclease n=1 Tax=Tundrisphaera lichenicola TaxID=2029860 RepID=UPI003EBA64F8